MLLTMSTWLFYETIENSFGSFEWQKYSGLHVSPCSLCYDERLELDPQTKGIYLVFTDNSIQNKSCRGARFWARIPTVDL